MMGAPGNDLGEAPEGDGVAAALTSLRAGDDFCALLVEDDARRGVALGRFLEAVSGPGTRVVRATNPLRSPLTRERLVLQVLQGAAAAAGDDAVIRQIAARRGGERGVVLVIERAETLDPEAVRWLAGCAGAFSAGEARLQVAFVGRPGFRSVWEGGGETVEAAAAPVGDARRVVAAKPYAYEAPGVREQLAQWWRMGVWTRVGVVLWTLAGVAALGFAGVLFSTARRHSVPVPAWVSEGGGAVLDGDTAEVRRAFEAYVAASGRDLAGMSVARRRAVYREFVGWRARIGGAGR